MSPETQGYSCSPITAHFPIKPANFGPSEICKRLQRIQAWPFNVCVNNKTVDLNPHQQEAVEYFMKK